MCSTVRVIHKKSLLLNQHNGDDAPQNYKIRSSVQRLERPCSYKSRFKSEPKRRFTHSAYDTLDVKQPVICTRRLSVDERLADTWSWPHDDLLTITTIVIRVKLLGG